jgi:hypothetical protein
MPGLSADEAAIFFDEGAGRPEAIPVSESEETAVEVNEVAFIHII